MKLQAMAPREKPAMNTLVGSPPKSLHVSGTRIPRPRFAAMLAAPDLAHAAELALGRVIDEQPGSVSGASGPAEQPTPAVLEVLAQNRFLRLAHQVFRRSHMGSAAVVAFVALRRLEVVNLITLSEGIKARLSEDQLRARLTPRTNLEAAYV